MRSPIIPLALAAFAIQPLAAQGAQPASDLPELSMEQKSELRCSVGLAIAHWPDETEETQGFHAQRREFFVRTTAKLMDETGAGREAIRALVTKETGEFYKDPALLENIMPACLLMLDASGL